MGPDRLRASLPVTASAAGADSIPTTGSASGDGNRTRRGRVACGRRLRGGQWRNPNTSANATSAKSAAAEARAAARHPHAAGSDHTNGVEFRMAVGGDAAGAESAIPARFIAAPGTLYVVATPLGNLRDLTLSRARCSRQRRYDRGRGYARDRRAAAALRHRDAPALAARAQRSARAARIVEALAAGAASRSSATPARRRSAIPVRGSCARCATRDSRWCPFPAPARRSPRCPPRACRRAIGCSWGSCRQRRKRGASCSRASRSCRRHSSIYEAPHRVRATVAELGASSRRRAHARRRARDHEEVRDDRAHDARGSGRLVRRRSQSRARRIRAGRRCAHRAGSRDRRIRSHRRSPAADARSSSSCRRRARRASRPPPPDCRATRSTRRRLRSRPGDSTDRTP